MMRHAAKGALAAMLCLVGVAQAQEELLWKADNQVSPTLVPAYAGWDTPFSIKVTTPPPDEEEAALAAARAEAERNATLAAQAKAEVAARDKAAALAARPNAIEAGLSSLKLGGAVQGPVGNSVLWDGKWLSQGAQIQVPTQVSAELAKTLSQLELSDATAGSLLRANLQQRLLRQSSISVTLVQVTSTSAIFSDGQKNYAVIFSQPAF